MLCHSHNPCSTTLSFLTSWGVPQFIDLFFLLGRSIPYMPSYHICPPLGKLLHSNNLKGRACQQSHLCILTCHSPQSRARPPVTSRCLRHEQWPGSLLERPLKTGALFDSVQKGLFLETPSEILISKTAEFVIKVLCCLYQGDFPSWWAVQSLLPAFYWGALAEVAATSRWCVLLRRTLCPALYITYAPCLRLQTLSNQTTRILVVPRFLNLRNWLQ